MKCPKQPLLHIRSEARCVYMSRSFALIVCIDQEFRSRKMNPKSIIWLCSGSALILFLCGLHRQVYAFSQDSEIDGRSKNFNHLILVSNNHRTYEKRRRYATLVESENSTQTCDCSFIRHCYACFVSAGQKTNVSESKLASRRSISKQVRMLCKKKKCKSSS